ncbi:uncharacterized protein F4822DRAFT_435458 [Hypoxylon trugodes]|uniref:uncharacterized protein n=1 Tax=Hypoxylon trugodes TaxID=326681 RepID=UPI00218D3F87|nr:uncharacterized protein F4822DRAFT_435458 [Hypoxylon trugodes]KAI1382556.1 hypothetical protein F4822DRAFT_435458 [Hypoxylon trugodes]
MFSPSDEDIHQVMDRCSGCSKDDASGCLQSCENDVEKAVQKFEEIKNYLSPEAPPSSDDSTPSQSSNDYNHEDQPSMPNLPVLSAPNEFTNNGHRVLAGKSNTDDVRNHSRCYDVESLAANVNADIEGYPTMFYIISTNDIDIIHEWIKHGRDPNAAWGPNAFPLVVFIDEFEKTSQEIHNTLLIPFEEGRYEDRRTRRPIDCSKTIWILATNKLDDTVIPIPGLGQSIPARRLGSPSAHPLLSTLKCDLRLVVTRRIGWCWSAKTARGGQ